MGYTHYWAYDPNADEWNDAFDDIADDVRAIADLTGIALIEYWQAETGSGPIITGTEIRFNGAGKDGHEDFELLSAGPDAAAALVRCHEIHGFQGYLWTFGKTARKPYDAIVCAVLIRAAQRAPNSFVFASDGGWEREWQTGAHDPSLPSGRHIVRTLWGDDTLPEMSQRYLSGTPAEECIAGLK